MTDTEHINELCQKLTKARLELENILLFLTRETPNIAGAIESAEDTLRVLGGVVRR